MKLAPIKPNVPTFSIHSLEKGAYRAVLSKVIREDLGDDPAGGWLQFNVLNHADECYGATPIVFMRFGQYTTPISTVLRTWKQLTPETVAEAAAFHGLRIPECLVGHEADVVVGVIRHFGGQQFNEVTHVLPAGAVVGGPLLPPKRAAQARPLQKGGRR